MHRSLSPSAGDPGGSSADDSTLERNIIAAVRNGDTEEAERLIALIGRLHSAGGIPFSFFAPTPQVLLDLKEMGLHAQYALNGQSIEAWIVDLSPSQIVSFFEAGLFDASVVLDEGESLLFTACRYDEADRVIALLSIGVDPHRVDNRGYSPALIAAAGAHWDCLEALFAFDASLRFVRAPNGRIPAHVMVRRADFSSHASLCSIAELTTEDGDGWTPLECIVDDDNGAALRSVLGQHSLGADILRQLLDLAVAQGSENCVVLINDELAG